MEIEKPEKLKEEHLKFLDDLKDTNITNMYDATPYIRDNFQELNKEEAKNILKYWMETYTERHKVTTVSLGNMMDKIHNRRKGKK